MKTFHTLSLVSVVVVSMAFVPAGGCAAPTESPEEEASGAEPASPGRVHLMLTDTARAALPEDRAEDARQSLHLTYWGGPVLQHVNVIPVYWNAKVTAIIQSGMNAFYAAISTGQFMSFLAQYSTASQTIGNGSRGTPFVDTQMATAVTDAAVQARLDALFTSGALPAPNNNNLYMVHFPAGVSITAPDGSKSCVTFCAYHGTYVRSRQNVYYGIVPDLGSGGCQTGCGASLVLENTTSVSSHEFSEAVTDPAVGIATIFGPPLAWYNPTRGEIGDMCNGQQTTTKLSDGQIYTVQREFSNATHSCVTP